MVKIKYMTRQGDEDKTCTLKQAKQVIGKEILDRGHLCAVLEPEHNIAITVEKTGTRSEADVVKDATIGKVVAKDGQGVDHLTEESTVGVFNKPAGG